mgnify:CR=1 FL=1
MNRNSFFYLLSFIVFTKAKKIDNTPSFLLIMYNNYDYSRFYSPSSCWTPMSGLPPMNDGWTPMSGLPPMNNGWTPMSGLPPMNNGWTPSNYTNGCRTVPVEVKPININLTVNCNKNFTVYQKEQVFNTPNKQIVVPEVNIKVTVEKYNSYHNKKQKYYRKSKNLHYSDFNSKKNSRKRDPPGNNQDKEYTSNSSSQTGLFPGAKMIEIDIKSLKGKNPLEEIINKLLGIEKNKESEERLEAPISKENNFDLEREYNELPFEVKNLNDLIALADLYDKSNEHMFGFNMKRLHIIKNSLINFNEVIGMQEVKKTITNKLITYLQGLGDMDDMNHIVIQAPPGYGKTMLGFHLSEIFYKLGLIKVTVTDTDTTTATTDTTTADTATTDATTADTATTDATTATDTTTATTDTTTDTKCNYTHPFTGEKIDFPFIVAKRKDMIGEYVGQTAPKVEKMVNKALGGVLFIDEAYSLGSKGNVSYSEECINTLNQLLSEKAGQFICIIAGYKDNLKESFFINPGLQRRFRMIFDIKKYNEKELALIFQKMVINKKWSLDKKILENKMEKLEKFMKTNQEHFKYCGGDMETLLQNVRDAHSMRVFGSHPKNKKIITIDDLTKGLEQFKQSSNRDHDVNHMINSLYI